MPYQHTLSICPINISHQYRLSICPVNIPYRYALSTHSINPPYHYTLSILPLNIQEYQIKNSLAILAYPLTHPLIALNFHHQLSSLTSPTHINTYQLPGKAAQRGFSDSTGRATQIRVQEQAPILCACV